MSAYFDHQGKLHKENWGDDINYWFLGDISEKQIISYDWSFRARCFCRPYILGIGSLLTFLPIENAIVWGSGIMSRTKKIVGRPKEVRAVRGPLSRNRLLEAGIDCPEVYGDPALLLPMFYSPKVEKKYKIGIIPHYLDQNSKFLKTIVSDKNVLLIDVQKYNHWLDFIDQINLCECIVSSSLHGLIISEAYGIPNIWMELAGSEVGDDVKYHDFFLSIGSDRVSYKVNKEINQEDLLSEIGKYKRGSIDLQPLINSCPFKLKSNFQISR